MTSSGDSRDELSTILVVDDDRAIRRTLERWLSDYGYQIETAADGAEALARLRAGRVDVCLLDLGLPGMDGMSVLRSLRAEEASGDEVVPTVIVISARDDMRTMIQAVQLGAYDYLVKPLDAPRIKITVQRALEQRRTSLALAHLVAEEREDHGLESIIGKSDAIRDVYKRIGAVSTSRATVLITGESGTGKELVARAIHFSSPWGRQPFVAANCTAFPPPLLESELFGHARGAFTGAVADKIGRFQLAGQGTLFLDEIGELSTELQAKLLRVLQERVFERVGDTRPIKLMARVVAATHRDLSQMLRDSTFREDLFYRLRVVEIHMPPLRERREDIPLLVDHLLQKVARETHRRVRYVSAEAMDVLVRYAWPGNVRELENALTRAVVLAKTDVLTPDTLPMAASMSERPPAAASSSARPAPYAIEASSTDNDPPTLQQVERRHIERVLHHTKWNKRQACKILDIARPTLDRKIRAFGLQRGS